MKRRSDEEISAPLYGYDAAVRSQYGCFAGVDEAGRGPLCGPVCVAACILDPENPVFGINDSKKLTEKKREALFDEIIEKALAYKIVFVGPEIIDRDNILNATMGGMKQIDPVGPNGQVIMDYSLYDARRAGFETVIFVIKHEIEDAFKAAIGDRVAKAMNVKYAFQQLEELPAGFAVPEGRVKPWGTCHAVLAAKPLIDGPFAVINADDYYGPEAFQVMYDYLSTHADDDFYRYCMVSYLLKNTLSENGSVARGVCIKNEDGTLQSVTERTRIEPCDGGAHYTEDGGESWVDLPGDTPVSMNLWGFGKSFLDEAEQRFAGWLTENLPVNPLKCEYFLPLVVTELIEEHKAKIQVLRSTDKWFGVTYREDKPLVMDAIARKTAEGQYPENLWK